MKQKPIRVEEEKVWEDITYTLGYYGSFPITDTISVQEQKAIVASGLSVNEVIDSYVKAYGDWQRDC